MVVEADRLFQRLALSVTISEAGINHSPDCCKRSRTLDTLRSLC